MKLRRAALNLICLALAAAAAAAAPASAQTPSPATGAPAVSLRPFFVATGERFAAQNTFKTVFGPSVQPMWGGGLEVALRNGFYVDVAATRFKRTGERAFFFDGQGFGLDIPLSVTITPLEVTAGGRFRVSPRIVPYAGAGVGSYRYQESSELEDEPFDARHAGYLVVGGVEFRVSRWAGISGDVQYTHVAGIIGAGGVSKEAGEDDLGGTAARIRVIIGR